MKRIWTAILALIFVLCLCACAEGGTVFEKTYKFPEGTSILGVDMTGLEKEEAWSQLEAAADSYVLTLTADGLTASISGKDMGISCSRETFLAALDAMEAGTEPDLSRVIRFNDSKLRLAFGRNFNKDAKNAAIIYDETSSKYVLVPHEEGRQVNAGALSDAVREAIRTLTPQFTVEGVTDFIMPAQTAGEAEALWPLAQANKMAASTVTYIFGAGSSAPTVHPIPAEVIRSFIDLGGDGFSPNVNREAIAVYAEELAAAYNTQDYLGAFRTTGGETIEMTIPYEGCLVDTEALTEDIYTCVYYGLSGERNAPYLGSSNPEMPYGGTYVEIDLTAQHLWYYKDGQCLVDTDLVSGNVALNMHTPTGVFDIYSRSRCIYLEGPNYKSYVNYWMPFTGGYGMHDALWRDEFGGDIYLDDGSHGCVNLPLEAAKTLYNNSTWGTRVIIYGGEGSKEPRQQEIIGNTEYTVAEYVQPFKLKMCSRYAWPEFFYESDNPDVATVSEDGTVTVTGVGTAHITVIAATENRYASAETTVTITVQAAEE